jgi:hypothetical protein
MICLVALDFVLRIIRAGVVDVAFVIHVLGVYPHDVTGDPADLGIPTHVIADLERFCHDASREAYFKKCASALVALKVDRQRVRR